jgi:hypothetical protein
MLPLEKAFWTDLIFFAPTELVFIASCSICGFARPISLGARSRAKGEVKNLLCLDRNRAKKQLAVKAIGRVFRTVGVCTRRDVADHEGG